MPEWLKGTACKTEQRGLAEAVAHLRRGDILVVSKLDRLGQSLPHLIETVTDLDRRKVGLRSLTESIDSGRLIFHVLGALGQFERDLVHERTRAGLSAAAAAGGKTVVTPEKLARAKALMGQRLNVREAAARLKAGKIALYEALAVHQPSRDRQHEQGKNGLLNRFRRGM